MFRSTLALSVVLFTGLAVSPARSADPHPPSLLGAVNPIHPTAEIELDSGTITGTNIGAAYHSVTRGDYGLKCTFGVLRALSFNLSYQYSNQSRTLNALTPAIGSLPPGFAVLRSQNVQMAYGSSEFNLISTNSAVFYISPGVGLARNAARTLTVITPAGTASAPVLPGNAVTFNLGAGVKIYPFKHWGIRLDLRDHVSEGGTGSLNPQGNLTVAGTNVANPQQYFGGIPINNNIAVTLGLILRIW